MSVWQKPGVKSPRRMRTRKMTRMKLKFNKKDDNDINDVNDDDERL